MLGVLEAVRMGWDGAGWGKMGWDGTGGQVRVESDAGLFEPWAQRTQVSVELARAAAVLCRENGRRAFLQVEQVSFSIFAHSSLECT
jgi:hypothetical protein